MATTGTRETKERILDAAECLFAEDGFDATSLRNVTTAAGVNLAAVNYHFGSKVALLEAVVRRVFEPVNARQLERLEELEAEEEGSSVEELLDAFVSPIFDLLDRSSERGRSVTRLFGRVMSDPGPEIRRMVIEEVGEVDGRYLRAFGRALPHLPEDELWWRYGSMLGVLVSHRVGMLADLRPPEAPPPEDDATERAWTTTFLSAALRAPAAEPHPTHRTR
jgi:AcrR family transcriptional regulator